MQVAMPPMPMWDATTYDKADRTFILYAISKGEEKADSKVHKAAMPFVRMAALTEFTKKFVPDSAGEDVKGLFQLDDFSGDWKYPLGFVSSQPTMMVEPQIAHGMQFTVHHPGGTYHVTASSYNVGLGKGKSIRSQFFIGITFKAESQDVSFETKRAGIINTWASANVKFESVEPKKDAQKMPLKSEWHAQLSISQDRWEVPNVKKCRLVKLPDGTEGECTLAKGLVEEMHVCGLCYAPRRPGDGLCQDACQKKRSAGGSSSNTMDFMATFKRLNAGKGTGPRSF